MPPNPRRRAHHPDGASTLAINPIMYKKVPYDPLRDFRADTPGGDARQRDRRASVAPVKSIAELIAYAKQRPASSNFASAGIGTSPQCRSSS